MGRTLVYPKVQKNTVHRKDDRATYDLHTIHSIINETPVLHVSFNSSDPEDPFPTILPMIGTMGSFAYPSADLNDPLECYLHGYVSSGIMKQVRGNPESGLAITIAATKVDGVVLSLTPNSHSYNYRSAVLFGYGSLVEDVEEKVWAMQLVTNSVVPGRWYVSKLSIPVWRRNLISKDVLGASGIFLLPRGNTDSRVFGRDHTRTPPDKAEMASTTILKVKIVNGSGKIRTGGPGDEKKDTEREDLLQRVWTGVVPMWETVGEPVAGGNGRVEDVPEHVRAFRDDTNKVNEKYAKTAAVEKA